MNSNTIILDNGKSCIRAGIDKDIGPSIIIPTITAKSENDFLFGNDAFCKRDKLSLNNPIERGVIKNWEEMEKNWELYNLFLNALLYSSI